MFHPCVQHQQVLRDCWFCLFFLLGGFFFMPSIWVFILAICCWRLAIVWSFNKLVAKLAICCCVSKSFSVAAVIAEVTAEESELVVAVTEGGYWYPIGYM